MPNLDTHSPTEILDYSEFSEFFVLLGKKELPFTNATTEELAEGHRYFQAKMPPKNKP